MLFAAYSNFLGVVLGWLLGLLSIFLVLLILVQRGRGGGLTGALGGPGGQSAFGSKAGDMFTRITFIVAGVWILLCAFSMWSLGDARSYSDVPVKPVIRPTSPEDTDPLGGLNGANSSGIELPPGLGGSLGPIDPPATETPATETPATETPATETPATETPATETPATETPATETPATETPAQE